MSVSMFKKAALAAALTAFAAGSVMAADAPAEPAKPAAAASKKVVKKHHKKAKKAAAATAAK